MSGRFLSILTLPLMALAHGQTVTAVAVANRAVTASISPVNGAPRTVSAPAGTPLPGILPTALQNSPLLLARVSGQLTVDPAFVALSLTDLSVVDASAGTADVDAEILLTLQASAPVLVDVQIAWYLSIGVDQPLPLVEADVGNTGTYHAPLRGPGSLQSLAIVQLGTAPYGIRLHTESTCSSGLLSSRAELRVVPYTPRPAREFSVTCSGLEISGMPAFDQSLLFRALPQGGAMQYLVVGLNLAPQPLPGAPNCLLMPTVDAVAVLGSQGLHVPVRAIPPGGFWAQAVQVDFAGVTGSNTLQVR